MRVLKGMNVSKLIDQDEKIFLSLIEDLFVGMKASKTSYKDLQTAISTTCSDGPYINHPIWNLKIVQVKFQVIFVNKFGHNIIHVFIYLFRFTKHL